MKAAESSVPVRTQMITDPWCHADELLVYTSMKPGSLVPVKTLEMTKCQKNSFEGFIIGASQLSGECSLLVPMNTRKAGPLVQVNIQMIAGASKHSDGDWIFIASQHSDEVKIVGVRQHSIENWIFGASKHSNEVIIID
ncbi:hypothetical protein CDAR_105951 [Caerostris darwini]|uniref:Uncharacterized protein n=1 Tax=Caerostris darwini TaxID=1538125 RepID=A0AAV4TTL7_9ARAC|nr:hypothetical protein CDAR_105951 [Caerostris darwini]